MGDLLSNNHTTLYMHPRPPHQLRPAVVGRVRVRNCRKCHSCVCDLVTQTEALELRWEGIKVGNKVMSLQISSKYILVQGQEEIHP